MKSYKQLKRAVLDAVQSKYAHLGEHLNYLVEKALFNCGYAKDKKFRDEIFQGAIDVVVGQLNNMLVFHGDAPDFFADAESSKLTAVDGETGHVAAGLRFMLNNCGEHAYPGRNAQNAVFKHNTEAEFIAAKTYIKQALITLQVHLATEEDADKRWLLQKNVHVLLSFFAFMNPQEYEKIVIPCYITKSSSSSSSDGESLVSITEDKGWSCVEFVITPILLNPEAKRRDRIYAYGLKATDNPEVKPYLVFRGTPPSAAHQGFHAARAADFTKGYDVGGILFESGEDNIQSFIDDCNGQKLIATGHSLGGSLALQVALSKPEAIEYVDAFCPAGLTDHSYEHERFAAWKTAADKPRVCVYQPENDIVSRLGFWADEWTIYGIVAEKRSLIHAHVINFLGVNNLVVFKLNTQADNARRLRQVGDIVKPGLNSTLGRALRLFSFMTGDDRVHMTPELDYSDTKDFEHNLQVLVTYLQTNDFQIVQPKDIKELKHVFKNFVPRCVQTFNDAIILLNAIGIGQRKRAGNHDYLANIRLIIGGGSCMDAGEDYYEETELSRKIGGMIKHRVCDLIREKEYKLTIEEDIQCKEVFSRNRANDNKKPNSLVHYEENKRKGKITITDSRSCTSSAPSETPTHSDSGSDDEGKEYDKSSYLRTLGGMSGHT